MQSLQFIYRRKDQPTHINISKDQNLELILTTQIKQLKDQNLRFEQETKQLKGSNKKQTKQQFNFEEEMVKLKRENEELNRRLDTINQLYKIKDFTQAVNPTVKCILSNMELEAHLMGFNIVKKAIQILKLVKCIKTQILLMLIEQNLMRDLLTCFNIKQQSQILFQLSMVISDLKSFKICLGFTLLHLINLTVQEYEIQIVKIQNSLQTSQMEFKILNKIHNHLHLQETSSNLRIKYLELLVMILNQAQLKYGIYRLYNL